MADFGDGGGAGPIRLTQCTPLGVPNNKEFPQGRGCTPLHPHGRSAPDLGGGLPLQGVSIYHGAKKF